MTSDGGAEALKAAIRRSLLLIVVTVLVGVVATNALRQARGPTYSASTEVLISMTPLSEIITNTVPPFVDPNRVMGTAQALAKSPEVYERAADDTLGALGTAAELRAATSASASTTNDILTFSAKSSQPRRAVRIANATARAYGEWRSDLARETIRKTVDQLRARLKAMAPDNPGRRDIENLLTKLNGLSAPGYATVVSPASSAEKVSPAPLKDTLLGASLGLVIALVLVAVREALDTTVRSESVVEAILAAPVLATVHRLPRRARTGTQTLHTAEFGDSYASLAATLARLRREDHAVLAVTSAVSGEGKTTTAANLAVALARRGSDVVLVDFDLRNPTAGRLFGLPADARGVVEVLGGSGSLMGKLWSVRLEGARPEASLNGRQTITDSGLARGSEARDGSLRVLPAGKTSRSEKGAAMKGVATVLEQLRADSDFVIIDTPPAFLTVELAELAGVVDQVLVVVRHGRVSQRSLRSLSRQARIWPAEVAGAVLTDAPASENDYAYYGASA
jgi:succinoglycan biosynthesis transport protein ExoP